MGTNFYLVTDENSHQLEEDQHTYENHIGKRSAAGRYCWKCHQTLCKQGAGYIHHSKYGNNQEVEWLNFCPKCGAKCDDTNKNSIALAAMKELGFYNGQLEVESPEQSPIGSCSSFSWAIYPFDFFKKLNENPMLGIQDEYGECYSVEEFKEMLVKSCPIQIFHSIGVDFS